jgi:hypothetical protein
MDRISVFSATSRGGHVELDKTVPTSGNLSIRGQQLWLGADRAGTPIMLRINTSYLRVFSPEF